MEHAILITLLEKIIPILEESDLLLEASYKARHALAVIDNNEGLSCMMSTVRETANFSSHDQHNISKFTGECQSQLNRCQNIITKRNQECVINYANEHQELQGFDFSQKLIPYKYKAEERIRANAFYSSFGKLIADFDVIIKCQSCSAFLQSRNEQNKIFEEIALGFTKIIFITSEKLCLNREFQHFISNMYNVSKVHFVIDEAHCILDYGNFRESWKKLELLKKNWPLAPIMLLTATCTYQDVQDICTSLEIPPENFAMI
ncbi:hypothetical protein C1646_674716 [Rhizophagus diaphanus]|nr:hypothetical protein C1646_674716 [Rhizophagus diaphanus] [Rhizophagus sp. MUCL 43196]